MLMFMQNVNISAAVSVGLETLLIPQACHLRTELHKSALCCSYSHPGALSYQPQKVSADGGVHLHPFIIPSDTLLHLYNISLLICCNSWFMVCRLSCFSTKFLCGHGLQTQSIIFITNMILLADLGFLQYLPFWTHWSDICCNYASDC